MKSITKTEFLWLISNNYIKQRGGRLIDVIVTNGKSRRKNRYVTDECFEKLKLMKNIKEIKEIKDIKDIKDIKK